ncbi:MAG: DUF5925 domain-containing protein [Sporichthyaceae bacterium]
MNPLSPEEVTDTDLTAAPVLRTPMTIDLASAGTSYLADAALYERIRHLPEWRKVSIPFRVEPNDLLPADASVVVNLRGKSHTSVVAEGPGFVLQIETWAASGAVFVAAMSAADADGIVEAINDRLCKPVSTSVPITLWRLQEGKARSWQRDLEVPEWSAIARNYPGAASLEALMSLESVAGSGRLMLWTGPPGTGKTYAIRALARAWSSWCSTHLVIDPEHFFGDAGYLIDVMSQDDDADDEDVKRARLIVCEDADEFMRARELTGHGLGRLLNVADGLLGQGLNNIVLLTSNTPVAQLDPALTRPGRMLANLQFPAFSAVQARSWLGEEPVAVPAGATLAELYELAGVTKRHLHVPAETRSTGAYL